jgi:hypothetical protein
LEAIWRAGGSVEMDAEAGAESAGGSLITPSLITPSDAPGFDITNQASRR